ncbi:MAG: Gfo/Idh/MocA family oxidoreductase [Candidatus Thorarchaeota archaeon]
MFRLIGSDNNSDAAKQNKHVFCEKPIDTDIKRIKETLSIVKEMRIKLMIGFNRRFDRNFMRCYESVSSGQVGEPQIVKITSRDPAPPPITYIKVSGGIFLDMTIHDWDMARFQVASEIEEVYATGAVLIDTEIGKAGDIDTAVAVLKFENGALGIIDNTRQAVYGYDQRVEVFGSKGCVVADNEATNTVRIYTSECTNIDKIPYFFMDRYMESYLTELKYFFQCLRENIEPKPNGEDGLQNVLVALAAQKSYEENRPVRISEVEKY